MLDNITIGQLREVRKLLNVCQGQSHSLEKGAKYFIRTVTYHYTGRVAEITDSDLVLTDAAWISDSGRYHDALINGIEKQESAEIEPIPDKVIIPRGVIVDCVPYDHPLPREQK